MKKFNILTLGCQMNERDSETLAGMLTEMGYEQIDDRNQADIAIINTCSVRDHADRRFFRDAGTAEKNKRKESWIYRMRMRLYDAATAYNRSDKGKVSVG